MLATVHISLILPELVYHQAINAHIIIKPHSWYSHHSSRLLKSYFSKKNQIYSLPM